MHEAGQLARAGLMVILFGLVPLAAWMTLAPMASAVIAPGVVKVDLNRRPVQHPEGGIVREVRVRVGQRVAEGEPLIVLGDVAVDADMQRWVGRVNAERASMARLEAEQGMAPTIRFPPELPAFARSDVALADLMAKERALFERAPCFAHGPGGAAATPTRKGQAGDCGAASTDSRYGRIAQAAGRRTRHQ